MRDYGVVRVRFWAWAERKKLSLEARDLALYLLTLVRTATPSAVFACRWPTFAMIWERVANGDQIGSRTVGDWFPGTR